MYFDGGLSLWDGVGRMKRVSLEVQRFIKSAQTWALHMVLCKVLDRRRFFSDNRGVVQALTGEVDCISAGSNDADLLLLVWSKVGECINEGFHIWWYGREVHTTLEEKAKMTPEDPGGLGW